MPALKETTPALYSATKEAAVYYATLVTTYMASFTLAQLVLKANDLGLETADGLLKLANCESCAPVVEGLQVVRREAAVIRRNGAKKNGTKKVTVVTPLVPSIMCRFSPWRTPPCWAPWPRSSASGPSEPPPRRGRRSRPRRRNEVDLCIRDRHFVLCFVISTPE